MFTITIIEKILSKHLLNFISLGTILQISNLLYNGLSARCCVRTLLENLVIMPKSYCYMYFRKKMEGLGEYRFMLNNQKMSPKAQ
jgi:hypothetical protein